jgi:hypothetical protein
LDFVLGWNLLHMTPGNFRPGSRSVEQLRRCHQRCLDPTEVTEPVTRSESEHRGRIKRHAGL